MSGVDEIFNNENFIREILLHVPAKQLLKCKCVSKQWLAIISELRFAFDHSRQNPNQPPLGIYLYRSVVPFSVAGLRTIPNDGISSLPPLDFLGNAKIVDTCNGLALALYSHDNVTTYGIFNLTTQKYRILPRGIDFNITVWRVFECLAFNPAKSPHYKVIILHSTKTGSDKITIFSSEEGFWKEMPLSFLPGVPATRVIYSNGAVHWLTAKNVHSEIEVDSEEIKTTPMGQTPKIRRNNVRYFGDCGGCLYLALGGLVTFICTMLEMEWETRLWMLKYRINFRGIISPPISEGPKFYVLDVIKRSNCDSLVLVLATPGGFVSYDPESGIPEVICDFLSSEFDEIPKELIDLGSYGYRFTASLFPI